MLSKTNSSQSRPRRSWLATAVLWVRRHRLYWILTSLILGAIIAIAALAVPAGAVQVRLSPTTLQLGDTLSVVIEQNPSLSSSPTVKVGEKTYPGYITDSGNFRALIPTTPLDSPGTLRIQVAAGGDAKNMTVPLRNRSFPTQRIRLSGAAGAQATQHELDRVAAFKALETPEKYWNGA
ncbi:MAG: M23 family peptidase, partial [Coleofasciculus sp. S288]|nr:M23 family peptidase [Coleofasciculus sp. S288]